VYAKDASGNGIANEPFHVSATMRKGALSQFEYVGTTDVNGYATFTITNNGYGNNTDPIVLTVGNGGTSCDVNNNDLEWTLPAEGLRFDVYILTSMYILSVQWKTMLCNILLGALECELKIFHWTLLSLC
jgi:hypothetical protein